MHRVTITRGRKLLFTVILFALAVAVLGVASTTHKAGWLFLAWAPLLAVAWVLTRPEPGMEWPASAAQADATATGGEEPDEAPLPEVAFDEEPASASPTEPEPAEGAADPER
jgi:hypothetical protein